MPDVYQRSRPGVLLLKGNYGLAGGPETLVASMARHIDRRRFDPRLVVLRRRGVPESPQITAEQLPIERTDLNWTGLAGAVLTAMKLRQIITEQGTRLIHTHDMRANLVAWLLTRVHKIPWIAHVHGWLGATQTGKWRLYEAMDRRLVCGADVVIVGSLAAKQDVEAAGVQSVAVLPNAIEIPPDETWRQDVAVVRSGLQVHANTLLVGIMGRVHPGKGHRFLLRAIARVRSEGLPVHCVVVGDGPDLESLRVLAAELGITTAVHFTGFCEAAMPFVGAMDVFVAPSLQESLPLAVLEAMAIRRPVIASRVGDLPAVIEHGYNGLLVPPGDADAIADAIRTLANDPGLRARVAQQARRTVEERFSAETMTRKLESIYSSLLGQTAAAV